MVFLPDYRYRYFYEIRSTDGFFEFSDKSYSESGGILGYNSDVHSIVSFSVSEEEFNVPVLSLMVNDRIGHLSKVFYRGRQFRFRWGIEDVRQKDGERTFNFLNFGQDYNDEVTGSFFRGGEDGILGYVANTPQGELQDGNHIFTVQIRAGSVRGSIAISKKYDSGTISELLENIASKELAISNSNILVNIRSSNKYKLTKNNYIYRDNETATKFIRRVCIEKGLKFQYQFNGDKKFLVVGEWGNSFDDSKKFLKERGVKGSYHYFDYGNTQSNIIDASYSINASSGIGSTVTFYVGSDGKINADFQPSPTETFTVLTLNQDRIEKELRGIKDSKKRSELAQEVSSLKYDDFLLDLKSANSKYRKFFKEEKYSTAPEMLGMEFNVNVVPNPLYQIGDLALVGVTDSDSNNRGQSDGASVVPPILRSIRNSERLTYYRIASVTWTHDPSGVKQEVMLKR